MKAMICGSRNIKDYEIIKAAIAESGFQITEVVSGGAKGVDKLGERWAIHNKVRIKEFIPDWNKYGMRAGFLRNEEMVDYVKDDGCVIAIWDGVSKGTEHSIKLAKKHNVRLFVKMV